MKPIMILNGPNLNLLGKRQPEIYGSTTLDDVKAKCTVLGQSLGFEVQFLQSNWEGQIVDWIHEARETCSAIIINAGAFTHYSYAILDALNAFDGLVYEVHISNVYKREAFRHHSVIAARADGVMAGFGVQGYELAMLRVADVLGNQK